MKLRKNTAANYFKKIGSDLKFASFVYLRYTETIGFRSIQLRHTIQVVSQLHSMYSSL